MYGGNGSEMHMEDPQDPCGAPKRTPPLFFAPVIFIQ